MILGLFYKVISLISLISGSLFTGTTFLRIMDNKEINLFNATSIGSENITEGEGRKLWAQFFETINEKYISQDSIKNGQGAFGSSGVDLEKTVTTLSEVNFTAFINDVTLNWDRFEAYLVTSEGISFLVGLLQVIIAFILILSHVQFRGANRSRHFSKLWNAHYFIGGAILCACLIVPTYLSNTEPMINFENFIQCLKLLPSMASKDLEFASNPVWFYTSVILDACVLFLLGIVTCCLSNKLKAK